jgi:hypothetical protein
MKRKISRETAIDRGLTRYFTGKPCKRDHICERYISGAQCVECQREAQPDRKRRYDQSPKGRETQRRDKTSPNGRETKRRVESGPKWREAHQRYVDSPKGIATRMRCNERRKDKDVKLARNRRRREFKLECAIDTTRDDYDPVRAARLLARWNARTDNEGTLNGTSL